MDVKDLDRISLWMGKPCTCEGEYWGSCEQHGNGGLSIPWESSDSKAVELIKTLVEKDYYFELNNRGADDRFTFDVWCNPWGGYLAVERQSTIAGAVAAAVLTLIEQEEV